MGAGGEAMRYEFKKGDSVPSWVERVEPVEAGSMTFEQDVIVFREPDKVHVLPVSEGSCVMRFVPNPDYSGPKLIAGAPTWFRDPSWHEDTMNPWEIKP